MPHGTPRIDVMVRKNVSLHPADAADLMGKVALCLDSFKGIDDPRQYRADIHNLLEVVSLFLASALHDPHEELLEAHRRVKRHEDAAEKAMQARRLAVDLEGRGEEAA